VTILESSGRTGGRVFTHYGDGWYADMGAMRFPPSHTILHGVVKALDLPLTPFTRLNKAPGSYFFLNGKYYNTYSLGKGPGGKIDEQQLTEIYSLFNITVTDNLRNTTGNGTHAPLLNPFNLLSEILDEELNLKEGEPGKSYCNEDQTLREFLRHAVANRSLPEGLIRFWGSLDLLKPFYDHSVLEFVSDSNQMQKTNDAEIEAEKEHKDDMDLVNGSSSLPVNRLMAREPRPSRSSKTAVQDYMELVNGSSSLPNELLRRAQGFGKRFNLKLHSQVVGVNQTLKNKPIYVSYLDVSNDADTRLRDVVAYRPLADPKHLTVSNDKMDNPQISSKPKTMSADRVIMTPPATALLSIELSPALPYTKYLALGSLNYFGSVKVVLAFTEAFWAKKNKAPTIRLVYS
jgi:hypothetical protein